MNVALHAAWRSAISGLILSIAIAAPAQTSKPAPAAKLTPEQQERADKLFLKTHYAKREYHIVMRDGIKLYTQVYTPIASKFPAAKFPFLMSRTPYGCGHYNDAVIAPDVTDNMWMVHSGYILVCQDVRGRWNSEGTWFEMTPEKDGKGIDESTDTYDSVDWLVKNVPANNGNLGLVGISYPGFYAAAGIIDSHPAIKAASPQAPVTNLWMGDDSYHGGAFMLTANHAFYAPFFGVQKNPLTTEPENSFKFGTEDMYDYYLKVGTIANLDTEKNGTNAYFHDQVVNTAWSDYWAVRDLTPHLHGVKAAVLDVGGWFDAEDLSGPILVFNAIDKLSPNAPENTLVEGPWVHGGWSDLPGRKLGDISFGSDASAFFQENIEAPFFAHWLKNAAWTPLPKAYTFETGSNVWKKYPSWPPPGAVAKTIYFQPNGGLAWTAPTTQFNKDEYVSDPAHPVPFTPYITGPDAPQRYMDDDQRFATTRSDVVVYESDPLTEDLTVAGPVKPRLKIASTGTDSDFVVKLIDVFPQDYKDPDADKSEGKHVTSEPPVFLQGYQMLIRGEPFRAKYRNARDKPEPLTPGKMTSVDFTMQDVNHTFLKGHRIMVQVQSSWFPLVDRNPQVFLDIAKAKPEDFVKATETIYHQSDAASGIELMVLPK